MPIVSLIKGKKERVQINKIRNEREYQPISQKKNQNTITVIHEQVGQSRSRETFKTLDKDQTNKRQMSLVAQLCPTLCDPMDCSSPGSSVHGDSPGKNTGVGCHALLWGSSQPRDQAQVSRIAGGFFIS